MKDYRLNGLKIRWHKARRIGRIQSQIRSLMILPTRPVRCGRQINGSPLRKPMGAGGLNEAGFCSPCPSPADNANYKTAH